MVPIPSWLTNYFTIHVIIQMVDRANEKVLPIYPQTMLTPLVTDNDQKDLKLRKEIYQTLKIMLDSDFIENQELRTDVIYNEWSSKVRLAQGLYDLILDDIKYIMTESIYTAASLLHPRMITHLWSAYIRDQLDNNGAYQVEYPDDNTDLHPIYKGLKIRLEKQEKYIKYSEDYTKLANFTSKILEDARTKGSTATLASLKEQYNLEL